MYFHALHHEGNSIFDQETSTPRKTSANYKNILAEDSSITGIVEGEELILLDDSPMEAFEL